MDNRKYKILEFLYNNKDARKNIISVLYEMYNYATTSGDIHILMASQSIKTLLRHLSEDDQFIEVEQYDKLGIKKNDGGYVWLTDIQQIMAKITDKGVEAIEKELNKGVQQRLNESILEVNSSTLELNDATKTNIVFQKNVQFVATAIAAVTTFFIIVSTVKECDSNLEEQVQGLKEAAQSQSQALQKLDSSLSEIKNAIQTYNIDTISVKTYK